MIANQGIKKSKRTQKKSPLNSKHKRSDFPLDGIAGDNILKDIEALKGTYDDSGDLYSVGLAPNPNQHNPFRHKSSHGETAGTKPTSQENYDRGRKYIEGLGYDDVGAKKEQSDDQDPQLSTRQNRLQKMNPFDPIPMSDDETYLNSLQKAFPHDHALSKPNKPLQDSGIDTGGGRHHVKTAYNRKTFEDFINGLKSELHSKEAGYLPSFKTDFELQGPSDDLRTAQSRGTPSALSDTSQNKDTYGGSSQRGNSIGNYENLRQDMTGANHETRRRTKVRKKGQRTRGDQHGDAQYDKTAEADLDGTAVSAMIAEEGHRHGNHSVYHIDDVSHDRVDLNVTNDSWLTRIHGHREIITVGCLVVGLGLLLIVFAIINIIINKRRQSGGKNTNNNKRYRKLGTARERQNLRQKRHSLFPLSSSEDDDDDDEEDEHNTDDEIRLDPLAKM